MTREMARLLISPSNAWPRLRQDYDHHPFAFLVPLLLLPLLPAACLFIGTTQVGWSLPGNDSVQHLSSGSALLLATMCYLGFVAGVVIMGLFVRWVLFRTPSRPSVPGSLTFTTAIAVPLMLAGIVALVPWRILLLLAAAAACAYSVRLLFTGLPLFMRMQERQTLFYAFCILGVGFLTLLTTAFIFIEFWGKAWPAAASTCAEAQPAFSVPVRNRYNSSWPNGLASLGNCAAAPSIFSAKPVARAIFSGRPWAMTRSTNWLPFIRGIAWSVRRMSSSGVAVRISRARLPESALSTEQPRSSSIAAVLFNTSGSSSTTSTRQDKRTRSLSLGACGIAPLPVRALSGVRGTAGIQMFAVVPTPGWLSRVSRPPSCSARPSTIDRPSPVPRPIPLVV